MCRTNAFGRLREKDKEQSSSKGNNLIVLKGLPFFSINDYCVERKL